MINPQSEREDTHGATPEDDDPNTYYVLECEECGNEADSRTDSKKDWVTDEDGNAFCNEECGNTHHAVTYEPAKWEDGADYEIDPDDDGDRAYDEWKDDQG